METFCACGNNAIANNVGQCNNQQAAAYLYRHIPASTYSGFAKRKLRERREQTRLEAERTQYCPEKLQACKIGSTSGAFEVSSSGTGQSLRLVSRHHNGAGVLRWMHERGLWSISSKPNSRHGVSQPIACPIDHQLYRNAWSRRGRNNVSGWTVSCIRLQAGVHAHERYLRVINGVGHKDIFFGTMAWTFIRISSTSMKHDTICLFTTPSH